MLELIEKSGPIFYPLALCSLIATVVTIERLIALRRARVMPQHIVEVVESVQPGRDLSVAIDMCRRNPSVLADIVRAGLENAERPWEEMRDAVLDAGRQETPALERNLYWLQTVAQGAPLMGLLGTVFGMIQMFSATSLAGLGDAKTLSQGISQAMFTTAEGLCIGIPALFAYNYLAARSERYILDIEAYASRLAARLRPGNAERGQ
jgi:biopolymer transport protein ExbB